MKAEPKATHRICNQCKKERPITAFSLRWRFGRQVPGWVCKTCAEAKSDDGGAA